MFDTLCSSVLRFSLFSIMTTGICCCPLMLLSPHAAVPSCCCPQPFPQFGTICAFPFDDGGPWHPPCAPILHICMYADSFCILIAADTHVCMWPDASGASDASSADRSGARHDDKGGTAGPHAGTVQGGMRPCNLPHSCVSCTPGQSGHVLH